MKKSEAIEPEVLEAHDPLTLVLSKEVVWGKEVISELHFKEIMGKHLKGLELTSKTTDTYMTLASRLTGHPPGFFDSLCAKDVFRIMEKLGELFQNSL